MASTRSQSTRSTRSTKSLAISEQMDVDDVVSGLQQLARGGSVHSVKEKEKDDGSKSSGSESAAEKTETASESSSFPNNLLEAAEKTTPMETEAEIVPESEEESSSSESSSESESEESSGKRAWIGMCKVVCDNFLVTLICRSG